MNHVRTSIETATKQGKKVRIFTLSSGDTIMYEIETLVVSINTNNKIQACVNMIYQIRDTLGINDAQNLDWHKQIPTMTLVIVDDYMQIEPYPYRTPQDKRKIFKINREGEKELYDVCRKAFENLWKDAEPAERTAPQHVP